MKKLNKIKTDNCIKLWAGGGGGFVFEKSFITFRAKVWIFEWIFVAGNSKQITKIDWVRTEKSVEPSMRSHLGQDTVYTSVGKTMQIDCQGR
jgi:hypothetical protein